jgi:hypothetical protein
MESANRDPSTTHSLPCCSSLRQSEAIVGRGPPVNSSRSPAYEMSSTRGHRLMLATERGIRF